MATHSGENLLRRAILTDMFIWKLTVLLTLELDIRKRKCRICLSIAVYAKESLQAAKRELTGQRKNMNKAATQRKQSLVNPKGKLPEAWAAILKSKP